MLWTGSATFDWSAGISNLEAKRKVARIIAGHVRSGQVIGIGSGSTSRVAIEEIGKRAGKERLDFLGIPTSTESRLACARAGIPCTSLLEHRPDWAFDGADEVDPGGNMIKGRGGAFYMEKLVARAAGKLFILIDQTKQVARLGTRFAIPIEVHPPAAYWVQEQLRALGATEILSRSGAGKDGPVITEHGNMILDARFADIGPALERDIKSICGVIESGLFWGFKPEVVLAE